MYLRRGVNTQLRADPNILQKKNTPISTAPVQTTTARIYLHEDNSPSRSVSRGSGKEARNLCSTVQAQPDWQPQPDEQPEITPNQEVAKMLQTSYIRCSRQSEVAPDHTIKLDRVGADIPIARRHGSSYRRLTLIGSDGSQHHFPFLICPVLGHICKNKEKKKDKKINESEEENENTDVKEKKKKDKKKKETEEENKNADVKVKKRRRRQEEDKNIDVKEKKKKYKKKKESEEEDENTDAKQKKKRRKMTLVPFICDDWLPVVFFNVLQYRNIIALGFLVIDKCAKSADPEVDSLVRSAAPVMTEATIVATPADVSKDKSRGFDAGRIRAEGAMGMVGKRNLCPGCVRSTIFRDRGKWRSLAEEKDILLRRMIGDEGLELKVTGLESTIAEKDHELSDLGASSSSLKSQNQSLVNQVHELEISSADLREKLEMYEGSLKQLEEFQDNLMGPLRTRLAEIDADFTRCCMRFQESFHPHLLNVVAGRRWLLTHGMKLLVVKCLNSNEYMEALGHAFGRAIEKGMQEGLAAGIEHGQAGRCLTDLEAYIPSAEDDFNSAIRDLRDLNFPLLQELSNKKDASTWDIMDLLRLDDVVAETLGMTDLQPDVSQLMVPVHHKQDRVVIGSQALSVALDICRGRVEKMERNLIERLPFLKDVFVSIDDPLSAEALIEPPVEVPATNVLSTVVIAPHTDPSVSVEDYDNPDLADVVPENATLGSESGEKIDASARGDLTFSQLDDEARDAVL
ncbi:hypothetical protein Tco_1300541 [Tanacetum coccineum]